MAQRRLAEEYERCQHYLDPATRKPLIAAVEAQLLERHIGAILEKGVRPAKAVRKPISAYSVCSPDHGGVRKVALHNLGSGNWLYVADLTARARRLQ